MHMHAHAQFHLQQSEVVRVREITFDLPPDVQDDNRRVTQLIVSKDGLYIYALTPRKVKQHYSTCIVRGHHKTMLPTNQHYMHIFSGLYVFTIFF